mmetsp:Transcript_10011/g.14439  ORF Transcript_10011/g.14439 Transcript_10011/m.14439 type:complete len:170 (+) Transcript_10011:426-935(+)
MKAEDEEKLEKIQGIHRKYGHASYNELVRLFYGAPNEFLGITLDDLKMWKKRDFCTGCIVGAMKEHPKYKSTKLLIADVPSKINEADLMFIETNQDGKQPLYVQMDVCTKYVTGVGMNSRKKSECMDAILAVKDDYAIKGCRMEELTFDREPGIVPLEILQRSKELNYT